MSLFHRVAMPALGVAGVLFAVPFSAIAADDEHAGHDMSAMDHSKHDSTAGQHIHHGHGKGGFMFEYKFMRMTMDGLLDGTDSVSTRDISGANPPAAMGLPPTNNVNTPYMMSPTSMDMDMHMVMAMYGITDNFTLMGMVNYLSNDMDMVMHMVMPGGATMFNPAPNGTIPMDMFGSMDTSGVGDTRIDGMFKLNDDWTASIGLSIPTGSIDEKVTMIMTNPVTGMSFTNANMQAPYAMQLGSGTYDLIPSITYQEGSGLWTFGGQASYTYHTGENDNDYALGDILEVTGYGKYSVNNNLTLSGRLGYQNWGKIDGADSKIPAMMVMMAPTNDPDNTGGKRADLLVGISGHFAKSHMISLEVGKPVLQDLNGPQMETDRIISIGYQYMAM